jgi:poly(hydroxyalkanoate) depolymerase family esterase
MNALPQINMSEATRLTREGRLHEALALLQGTPPSGPRSAAPASPGSELQRPEGRMPPLLGKLPPLSGVANSWAPPQSSGTNTASAPGAMVRPPAKTFRDILGRVDQPGFPGGLSGLVGRTSPRVQAPLPDGARFEDRTFANEAGRRSYKLYIPSGYRNEPLPLVVMLHGCTQSPEDFAAGTRMNELAEEQTFLVAYPAQTQSANASKCWNWFSASDQRRDHGEPSLIAGITREIMRDFPVEQGRVYIAGLSAGGAAAAIMGVTYPDLYAAIGVHSGLACGAARDMPSAFAAMRQGGSGSDRQGRGGIVPTIVFHGDRDTTVHPSNGDQVIAQSKDATRDLQASVDRGESPGGMRYTRTVQADENGLPVLEQWVLHGAGHAWSGGSDAGSYTEPGGPDASREMVRFFLQHSTAAETIR